MGAPAGNMNGVKWTPEQDDKLKQLYADQLSCAAIADRFPGKTRNSIIGRVHRLKLPLRGGPKGQRAARTIRETRPRMLVPRHIEVRCEAIKPKHVTLLDLEPNHCRWPYGDGPFTFCGHDKFQGSYCAAHYFLSIGPGTPGERAAERVTRMAA